MTEKLITDPSLFDNKGLIWFRFDVDNPLGFYTPERNQYRPEHGWYDDCRKTLQLCKDKWPDVRRIWQIRDCGTPVPKDLFADEELALHVSEPLQIEREYKVVVDDIGRELPWYTRHGGDRGRIWSDEPPEVWGRYGRARPMMMPDDLAYVHRVLPHIIDITKRAHYTIGSLRCKNSGPYTPEQLTYDFHKCFPGVVLDHILFHPEHWLLHLEEFTKVGDFVDKENKRRMATWTQK